MKAINLFCALGVFAAAFPDAAFERTETATGCTLATGQAQLSVSRKDGSVMLAAADGTALTRQIAPVYQAGGRYDLSTPDELLHRQNDAVEKSRTSVVRALHRLDEAREIYRLAGPVVRDINPEMAQLMGTPPSSTIQIRRAPIVTVATPAVQLSVPFA